MVRIAIVISVLLALACTPQKKLNRLVKKHPELVKVDTLRVHDTTITEHVRKDTVLNWNTLYDTAYIVKDKLSIRVVRVNDSIYINGQCASDTIYKTIEVPYNYVQPVKKMKTPAYKFWLFILVLIGIILLLFKLK
jgi:sporulation protein YlmC with PRC-barrel domain